ncbi:penicillin-binding protein 1A [Simiduia curdlanivorans]|uniref:Penicillin-binding protein 1A n=1 Tax=Simiduia curdlanivorans TaxID=1492769 RepID=A0ABV8V464_9GAMM|nr:penicillin-binding protein 1A [Simiduia curdlanivorans]MDN3637298.1 penicillin-binding protein 1A [Simiduia curdlanivorans]
MEKISKNYRTVRLICWLLLAGISATALSTGGLYLYLSPKLPSVEALRQIKFQTPLRIYSADGKLIGEFGEKRRSPIRYDQIPQAYIDAILAAEDDQFYKHHGVSIKGLLRAASQILQTGQIQGGGSTITMQVARNFFLTFDQTFLRKANEILLAIKIENELSKPEILELYVNKIYLGNRAYGIEAASQVYYGKSIDQLNLAQLAMIAGLPKAPSRYNPIANPPRATIRRNWILGRMLELGKINQAQYTEALNTPLSARFHELALDLSSPYVAEVARQQVIDFYGEDAYSDGLKVYTTIDTKLQETAQKAVVSGLLTYDSRHGYRGPEKTIKLNDNISEPEERQKAYLEELNKIPVLGGLQPAIITEVFEQSATALLGDGNNITLEWEQGLASAQRYINEDRVGSPPTKASQILSEGDLVRLLPQSDQQWQLSQVPAAQSALVALNPEDGAIVSLVGGFDFRQSHFNRAVQAERQPGSSFKPFIYTAALESGFTPATLINDAPIVFEDASLEGTWRPENDSGQFLGPTRMRQALYQSRNLVSIRILRSMGIRPTIEKMARFGFDTGKLPRDLSLALGSHAVTPLQIATGYAVFANGGFRVEPYLVKSIADVKGDLIFEENPLVACRLCPERLAHKQKEEVETEIETTEDEAETLDDLLAETAPSEPPAVDMTATKPVRLAKRILDERDAFIIDSMLRDVVKKGTGKKAMALGRDDLAGKTGTTNGPRDAWFSGYNHQLVATAWLGFDQNFNLGRREYGGSAALPVWIDFMSIALDGMPEAHRRQPDGIITVRIDPKTGKRAQPGSSGAIFEIFKVENAPEESDATHSQQESLDESDETLPEELF